MPGQQWDAAQWQQADICKLIISAKVVTLHTILLGVGRTFVVEVTHGSPEPMHLRGATGLCCQA
eukprot:1161884-Pelagomonas_calceolata.AAC.7